MLKRIFPRKGLLLLAVFLMLVPVLMPAYAGAQEVANNPAAATSASVGAVANAAAQNPAVDSQNMFWRVAGSVAFLLVVIGGFLGYMLYL